MLRGVLLALLLPLAACGFLRGRPTTWAGRYAQAMEDLKNAEGDEERFYAIDEAAKAAVEVGKPEEAERYAKEALEMAPRFRKNWNYGNAVHDGHMVLGRVALRHGDVETAKSELILAGQTPGSPQLGSFGPNVSLAKELLEQKQVDAVVEYFDLCGKFWELERGRLKQWSALAKAGELPDFGANLFY
jgi:tetratricopeptide (TPR) repeat protein